LSLITTGLEREEEGRKSEDISAILKTRLVIMFGDVRVGLAYSI
jgi:hypothetical protein